jgi:hypothetical protein
MSLDTRGRSPPTLLCYLSVPTRKLPVQTETALFEHSLINCLVVRKVGEPFNSDGSHRYLRR